MNDRHLRLGRPPRPTEGRSPTSRMRSYVLERDGFRCRRCGACASDGATLVVDHIVPYSVGGKTEEPNLQTLCQSCNAGKSDRAPHEHDLRAPIPAKPAPPAKRKDGLVGTWVLRPRGKAKRECPEGCGRDWLEFWRGQVVDRLGPNTYRVQWFSWLDGADTNSDVFTTADMENWHQFSDEEEFESACRWVLTQHDHKNELRFAGWNEPEPPRTCLAPR